MLEYELPQAGRADQAVDLPPRLGHGGAAAGRRRVHRELDQNRVAEEAPAGEGLALDPHLL